MNGAVWLYIVICGFAALGVWTFIRGIAAGTKKVMDTANDLVTTLKEATEIARAYREDLGIIRQIAQSSATLNPEEEPESIIPPTPPVTSGMPSPYWGKFPVKVHEEDAPAESLRDVDLTPNTEEIIEQERNEAALDFEAQERQKAATREADQARLKEIAELSGQPEGQ